MTEELETLVATPTLTEIGGERLTISALKVGQLPAFLRAAQPILDELQSGDILAALSRQPDSAIEAIAVASGRPRAWLDALELDDLVALGALCLEINADFFVRRLLPRIEDASGRLSRLLAGSASPSGLSPTATGTAT